MAAVEAGSGRIDPSEQRSLAAVRKGYTSFLEGDVIFAKITPCMENGKTAVAKGLVGGIGFGSTEFHVLRPNEGVNAEFLYYYIAQEQFRQDARARMTGTAGQLRVPTSFMAEAAFPLPPLAEQRRIVAATEEQFTRLDAGVAALKSARARLKQYRAAVLKAAVEGELTQAWREAHPDTEPASELLARILAERQPPKGGKSVEPTSRDNSQLPALPHRWLWVTLGQIGEIGTGATPLRSRKDYYDGGTIPWITSGALNEETITHAEELITRLALRETNAKLFPKGTILVAMYGEGKTRGKAAVLEIEAATNQACAAIVMGDPATSMRQYTMLFLLSNYYEIRRFSAGGVQPNLNLSIIKNTLLPLPPLMEQEQVVAEAERRLSVLSALEMSVEVGLKRAERLRQSILTEAFSGRLVPQDFDDEPASALLAKVARSKQSKPSQMSLVGVTTAGTAPGKAGARRGRSR